jgi:hypothetical protein
VHRDPIGVEGVVVLERVRGDAVSESGERTCQPGVAPDDRTVSRSAEREADVERDARGIGLAAGERDASPVEQCALGLMHDGMRGTDGVERRHELREPARGAGSVTGDDDQVRYAGVSCCCSCVAAHLLSSTRL